MNIASYTWNYLISSGNKHYNYGHLILLKTSQDKISQWYLQIYLNVAS